jgi:NAD(P)-dependent dehydrogenase (short-subunit alcohol dehydrogenase family)
MTAEHSPNIHRLAGKVAIVTGAGSGIGRAAAIRLAREGASVALAGRREAELNAVADEIGAFGGQALAIVTDVTDETAVKALVSGTVARFGRLDVAFNNAGINAFKPIEELTVEDFDRVIGTNVRGVWLLVKYQVEAIRAGKRGGSIINTSSIAATGGNVNLSIYGPSKGALDALVRSVALEIGPDNIRINNISPGVIKTPMIGLLDEQMLAPMAGQAALKRLGEPEDIGDVVAFLASDDARFITGQAIVADGGYNIGGAR